MATRVNVGGLVIAGIGFFLTRFTVTLAIYDSPVRFYFAGVVPLALGLGLAAFGVALAVVNGKAPLVRTTALWCVIGAGTMLVLVVLTLLGSTPGGVPELGVIRTRTYLSNFLIGGSVGGALTGLYAARNRDQRHTLRRQSNRLEFLNRLLRHEVLNAVSVIRGYSSLSTHETPEKDDVIDEYADVIERTIEDVKYLTRHVESSRGTDTIDLAAVLVDTVDSIRDRYPAADIALDLPDDALDVRANDRLGQVFEQLLENAIVHAPHDDPRVAVSVSTTTTSASISVTDAGTGLPAGQQALLETGEIPVFDDPRSGFGLNVVRFLVEGYGGGIETDVTDDGTTITVAVPLASPSDVGFEASDSGLVGVRLTTPHLVVTLIAALIAGIPYGVVAEQLGGSIAAIGVFYGIDNAIVGWLTHEFHSVVFGFVFAGLVAYLPARYHHSIPVYTAVGVGWAVTLWLFAAGVIAPVWLRLLGIPAAIPNLSGVLLASHLAWGVSIGVLTAFGYRHVRPWLDRRGS